MIGFPKSRSEMGEAVRLFQSQGALPSKGEMARALREQADRYIEKGLPGRKTEGWRHFPIQKISKAGFGLSANFSDKEAEAPRPSAFLPNSLVVSVENGRPRALFGPEEGVAVVPWRDVLHGGGPLDSEKRERIMRSFRRDRNSLCAFNNALPSGGWVIVIEGVASKKKRPAKQERPLEIQYLQSSGGGKTALNLRNFLFLPKGRSAQILEVFYGGGASGAGRRPFLLNAQTDCFLGEKSRLNFFRIDKGGERDSQVNQLFGEVGRGAKACFLTLSLASGISRYLTDLSQKEASAVEARGLALLGGSRHSDHKTVVSHIEKGGFSRQMYRSILFDSARSIFNGVIKIEKQAQKTSSSQMIRNLIFGEKAFAVSCPELDVGADDVKAFHGASVSSLKESREALCYLRSRGLGDFQAVSLILSGLIREVFSFMDKRFSPPFESLIWSSLEALRDSAKEAIP